MPIWHGSGGKCKEVLLIGQKRNSKEVSQNQYARFAENMDVLANRIPHASRRANPRPDFAAIFFPKAIAERAQKCASFG
jgi:hypothetical protein